MLGVGARSGWGEREALVELGAGFLTCASGVGSCCSDIVSFAEINLICFLGSQRCIVTSIDTTRKSDYPYAAD